MKLLHKFRKFALALACIVVFAPTLTANATDFLRSTGKIYSVVAVIAVVFLGIAVFLYRLDNKLTKLENQSKDEQ